MKKTSVLLLLLLSFTLPSCIRVFGKLTFSDSKSWIPKDFSSKDDVLLIEQYPDESINEEMISYLRKDYRGKFEVVKKEMILDRSGKYPNAELYRYAFLWETTDASVKPIGHFFDRSVGKHYPATTKINRYQVKNAYRSYINTIDLHY